MLPLHRFQFAFWIPVVNPRFDPSKQMMTELFFCHLCTNPEASDVKPCVDADHAV